MKHKREACNSKHNKLNRKKSKKILLEAVASINMRSRAKEKKYREKQRTGTGSEAAGSSKTSERRLDDEGQSYNGTGNKRQGPINRKRIKFLQSHTVLLKHPSTSTETRKTIRATQRNELETSDMVAISIDSDDSSSSSSHDSYIDEGLSMDAEDIESSGSASDGEQKVDDDIADASFDAAPQFFNSSNSRQVLLLLKKKIYFHGALKIRLLAGKLCIFGYTMQQNETVTANSPRGHSFLYLSPSPQSDNQTDENSIKLEAQLKEFSDTFLWTDRKKIISNFDSSSDAVVLLENDSSKSIFMIENYMKETVFPNVNTFTCRPFHHSESILRSQFLPYTTNGLKINPEWQEIAMTSNSRQVIIGGKGVGKSTFLRYLINKNVKKFNKILLIDLDIGQPETFLPQTVSATVITEPILGPGYLRNKTPHKSYLFGDVNVLSSSIKYLKCVLKLLKYCISTEEFRSMPWLINTMGYNRGFGLELMVAILRVLKPTDLIQIQSCHSANNFENILNADEVNDFRFNFFHDEVQDVDNNCTYKTYVCSTMSQKRQKKFWDITPKDLRFAMILSKLGNILKGNAKWITDVKPVCASLNDIRIFAGNDDNINPDLQPSLINGNLVYLCQSKAEDDDEILECYGLGVVRAVDMVNNKAYLLPSIPAVELQHVNTLAICSIPLPTAVLINQSSKITGSVPYVYSSDNFVGSKQIVPISYRPDKQMSKNSQKIA